MRFFFMHLLALLVVVVTPPVVYDAVAASRWHGVDGLLYIGALTCPAYAIYWTTRLKSTRLRFMLQHLVSVLSVSAAATLLIGRSTPEFLTLLPIMVSIAPLLLVLPLLWRGQKALAVTCALSSMATLLMGAASSLLIIYGLGMASMPAVSFQQGDDAVFAAARSWRANRSKVIAAPS